MNLMNPRLRACAQGGLALLAQLALSQTSLAQTAPGVRVDTVSMSADQTVLRVTVPTPMLANVETSSGLFQRFAQKGGTGAVSSDSSDVGLPEVPVAGFSLALPVDGKGGTVDIVPEGGLQRLPARLYPIQPPISSRTGEDGGSKFQFNADIWAKGYKTPGQKQGESSVFHGDANVQGYQLSPYGYDPAQQLITYYPSYLVTIKHPGTCFRYDRLKLKGVTGTTQSAGFDGIDQRIEKLALPAVQFALNKGLVAELTCAPPIILNPAFLGARYLIVTHPNFKAAADALKAHKEALGISTRVVTTAEITGAGANATETQIRNWISNYYSSHLVRPKWVLFMGDAEYVPTHYDANKNIWDMARNAGDMWYGQFQPGDGPTTIPPFGIGRFPVDTLAQANTIVSKVIAFENSPPLNSFFGQDFYSRLTFGSFYQVRDNSGTSLTRDRRWFVQTSEIVRDHAIGLGYDVSRFYTADADANPQFYTNGDPIPAELTKPTFAWNGSKAGMAAAINKGSALVYHRDHGWWDGWGDPSFLTSDLSLVSVTNNQFPVVFSINCASGVFDNETVDLPGNIWSTGYGMSASGTYWAESFLRKADGALAVIGDTRQSSTTDNNQLTLGLFDGVFPGLINSFGTSSPVQRLGDLLNYAKTYVHDVANGSQTNRHPLDANQVRPGIVNLRQELNIYNLLGDPTVKLRVSPPWKFSIPIITLESNLARIKVPFQPGCLTCPPNMPKPEWITAIAIDPLTGGTVGRGLIDDNGNGSIDLGDFKGNNVWIRVGSPDGATTQAASTETDSDGDGIPDSRDNCIYVPNKSQLDTDGDGYGNACDADLNNDGFVNSLDLSAMRNQFGKRSVPGDLNGDGIVNSLDISLFAKLFGKAPGPSAFHLETITRK
ncbi:MAG TPA: C25 family cysteine peptidase [Aquabacterium sp.]|uniref:C25 family cysteine peptidase n=1 Tax=Aquabacterium sp. TaxID=1872578 RepID=UPI002E328F51|nr:C25 family cysteine peptidase [Aquabacterium sp.]HEX5355562.1 C25 family cysteine peptidase [Aquabacterium sp.]